MFTPRLSSIPAWSTPHRDRVLDECFTCADALLQQSTQNAYFIRSQLTRRALQIQPIVEQACGVSDGQENEFQHYFDVKQIPSTKPQQPTLAAFRPWCRNITVVSIVYRCRAAVSAW